jgi:hypothetical protein
MNRAMSNCFVFSKMIDGEIHLTIKKQLSTDENNL